MSNLLRKANQNVSVHGSVKLAFLRHSNSIFVPGAGEYLLFAQAKLAEALQCYQRFVE